MKNFLYLVQGRSDLVKEYYHLQGRDSTDAIFLTYDKKMDGAIYFPDSTWSEGRNKLLSAAREKGEYLYYIFCDDDIEFKYGNWDEFEKLLLSCRPAIGCPVFYKTRKTRIFFLKWQTFLVNDEQLMAIHNDLVKDRIVVPYRTDFDHLVWIGASVIQERLIQTFYFGKCLQFNTIKVLNNIHNRHDVSKTEIAINNINNWMGKEFRNNYTELVRQKKHKTKIKLKILFYTIKYYIKRIFSSDDYTLDESEVLEKLNTDSNLLKQYNEFKK